LKEKKLNEMHQVKHLLRRATKESIDTTRGPMDVRERERCGDGDDGDTGADGAANGAI
jgi:hypothetical protein